LPAGASGQYHVFVVTDAAGQVFEYNSEGNNVTEAGHLLAVAPAPFADLVVADVTVPATGASGKPLNVSWTVRNQGTGGTNTSSWQDRVVLSGDTVLGNADDVLLGTVPHSGTLAKDATYTQSGNFVLPNGIAGNYHVFVTADSGNAVDEFLFEDN